MPVRDDGATTWLFASVGGEQVTQQAQVTKGRKE